MNIYEIMLFRISNRIVTKMGFEVKISASTGDAMLGTYSKDISTLHYLLWDEVATKPAVE